MPSPWEAAPCFCIDSLTPVETERTKSLSEKGQVLPSVVLTLDARTGSIRWSKTTMSRYRAYRQESWQAIQGHDDWLAYCRESKLVLAGKLQNAWAFQAETGKEVWHAAIGGAQPLILGGETFLHQGGTVLETRTGKPLGAGFTLGPFGCNYVVGSEHLLCLRAPVPARFVNTATHQACDLYAIRSGCSNSLIPADGLVNALFLGRVHLQLSDPDELCHVPSSGGRWLE